MAEDLGSLRARLSKSQEVRSDPIGLLQSLACLVNSQSNDGLVPKAVQELVLFAREHSRDFGKAASILDALILELGLFPYVDQRELSFVQSVGVEAFRTPHLGVILHRAQAQVLQCLEAGENVILSAPTSFGKSLLIDAAIAVRSFKNVVVVVPTIALIDETRRRLVGRFGDTHKVVTHPGQELASRNILVLTQERLLQLDQLPKVDFFVVDEFYKLDPKRDSDRSYLLNEALYRLLKTGAQFYLLGPGIRSLPSGAAAALKAKLIVTDFATVASEEVHIDANKTDRLEKLLKLCQGLKEQTLIYCASPKSASRVAAELARANSGKAARGEVEAANWVAETYHPDWVVARALRRGVGLHHGRMPRALSQFVVRAFNEESLKFLVCTSTLIEGVNTKAKNVIIYDNRVARQKFDFFTFNNIRGRSGRMFEHFVGRVFMFNRQPQEELPFVDVPLLTQPESSPLSFLIQLDPADLRDGMRERLEALRSSSSLPLELLRQSRGIDPQAQQELAHALASDIDYFHPRLRWKGLPNWDELVTLCELIWKYFVPGEGARAGVLSGLQLAYRLRQLSTVRTVRSAVLKDLARQENPDADEAVEGQLEFRRYWASFHFPRLLMAVDRIQRHVFHLARLSPGDYTFYAARVESEFTSPGRIALEEFGVPVDVTGKLPGSAVRTGSVDEAVSWLLELDDESLSLLGPFERRLVFAAIEGLGAKRSL